MAPKAQKQEQVDALAQAGLPNPSPGDAVIPSPPDAAPPVSAAEAPSPITYFVGFERRGSSKYGIVTGKVRLSDGVLFDVKVDPITQDLGETSHGVLAEFQKLSAAIP